MDQALAPLKKYADFQGRARRAEYWMFWLAQVIFYCVIVALAGILGGFNQEGPSVLATVLFSLYGIAAVALIIPNIAVTVRRLHDTDRSGFWIFIAFVPAIGGIWLFILTVLDGTAGPNKFGPDPKGRGESTAAVFA